VLSGEADRPECAALCEEIGVAVRRLDAAWMDGRDAEEAGRLARRIRIRAEALQQEHQTPFSSAVVAAARGVAEDLVLATVTTRQA
jgi:hypothetical protein